MRAVVFDWDLTLWDSWGIHLRLMEQTAADLARPVPSAADVAAEFHRPFRQHLVWFFGSSQDADAEADAILDAYLAHYYRIAGHRNYLYPGAASLLRALRRRGLRIGILSDKQTRFGMPELEQSGLAGLVDYANFKTDARPYKPDPQGLRQTLNELAVSPAEAMYVGDGPQDIACARDAGATSAAAMWATIDYDAILAQRPAYRLHRPHQVIAVVDEANGYAGSNPWVRHLPWPWRPRRPDNPRRRPGRNSGPICQSDSNGGRLASTQNPDPPPPQFWPMAARWHGRSGELRLPARRSQPGSAAGTAGGNGEERLTDENLMYKHAANRSFGEHTHGSSVKEQGNGHLPILRRAATTRMYSCNVNLDYAVAILELLVELDESAIASS